MKFAIRNRINKICIILTITGIVLFIIRSVVYINVLGYGLDFVWSLMFSLALYNSTNKIITVVYPSILGIGIEVFQLICKLLSIGNGGYYPGTPDILDIVAYISGSIIAYIIIQILLKREEKSLCN